MDVTGSRTKNVTWSIDNARSRNATGGRRLQGAWMSQVKNFTGGSDVTRIMYVTEREHECHRGPE